jgi:hypothetical protein
MLYCPAGACLPAAHAWHTNASCTAAPSTYFTCHFCDIIRLASSLFPGLASLQTSSLASCLTSMLLASCPSCPIRLLVSLDAAYGTTSNARLRSQC